MEPTEIVIRRDADATVAVVLLRRVTGLAGEEAMWSALAALADAAPRGGVVLDCGQVQHLSSPALGRLIALARHCRESHTRFVIRGLCPALRQLVRILRLDTLLEIEADEAVGGTPP